MRDVGADVEGVGLVGTPREDHHEALPVRTSHLDMKKT